jgi:hypothetical protein
MVNDEKIKELAYSIWEEEGRPEGKDVEHYFRARKIMEETYATPQAELASSKQNNVELTSAPSPAVDSKRPVLNVYRGHTKRGHGLKQNVGR